MPYDRADYIKACNDAGVEPKLSEIPEKVYEGALYTKSGKFQSDGTPVYQSLDKETLLNNKDILRYSGADPEIGQGTDKYHEANQAALSAMTDEETKALTNYTKQYVGTNYSAINHYLITGEGSDDVKKAAETVTHALDKPIGADCITCRGTHELHGTGNDEKLQKIVDQIAKGNFFKAGQLKDALTGKTVTNDAVMSTSPNSSTSGYGSLPIQYVFKTPADAKAVDITAVSSYGGARDKFSQAFGSSATRESEVAFKPGTKYKIDDVQFSLDTRGKKKAGQDYVVATIQP